MVLNSRSNLKGVAFMPRIIHTRNFCFHSVRIESHSSSTHKGGRGAVAEANNTRDNCGSQQHKNNRTCSQQQNNRTCSQQQLLKQPSSRSKLKILSICAYA